MRKTILITALMLLTASGALAGMTYDFASRNEKGKGSLSGSAAIEGEMMRLDLTEGDDVMFKDGSVMISRDGGKTFYIIDPKNKEYYVLDLNQLLSAAGSLLNSMGGMFKLSFENHKVTVTEVGDGGVIEGYSTTKYVSDSSYDMVMSIFGKENKQSISTHSVSWLTKEIDARFLTFVQQKGFKTGIESLDELLEKETAGMEGFPLKQEVTTTQTAKGKSETSKTTMTITSIQEADVPAGRFEVPSDYEQVEGPMEALQNLKLN